MKQFLFVLMVMVMGIIAIPCSSYSDNGFGTEAATVDLSDQDVDIVAVEFDFTKELLFSDSSPPDSSESIPYLIYSPDVFSLEIRPPTIRGSLLLVEDRSNNIEINITNTVLPKIPSKKWLMNSQMLN